MMAWWQEFSWIWLAVSVGALFVLGLALRLQAQRRLQAMAAQSALQAQQLARLEERLQAAMAFGQEQEERAQRFQQQHSDLNAKYAALHAHYQQAKSQQQAQKEWFESSQSQLQDQFELLAKRVLMQTGQQFEQSSQQSLNHILNPLAEKIDGFQRRLNELHSEQQRGQTHLATEIKQLAALSAGVTEQAYNLTRALKGDKKTTGNWGEMQLARALELAGLEPGVHYQAQHHLRDAAGGKHYPDFVLLLPDDRHIVMDSKVSLVDYDRALAAESELERQQALEAHVRAVKQHIDSLANKDYSNLPGMKSPSFVLMFMPIEPAYIEAMKYNKDLFQYGYERNVVLVSHTTLMPILKTLANLWTLDRSNQQAMEVASHAGAVYNQVMRVAERLQKMGASLSSLSKQYNSTVLAVSGQQGLYGKVDRFKNLSVKANRPQVDLKPVHLDLDEQRLDSLVEPEATEPGPLL